MNFFQVSSSDSTVPTRKRPRKFCREKVISLRARTITTGLAMGYFWEYSPLRAEQFVREKYKWQGRKDKVAAVGAIIDPGLCLNLLDAKGLSYLEVGYDALLTARGGEEFLPKNGEGKELWKRKLDCAVINMVHELRAVTQTTDWQEENPDTAPLQSYDTVRGAFWEGGPIYPGARIEKKNHVQICVRNSASIIGYFRPIPDS